MSTKIKTCRQKFRCQFFLDFFFPIAFSGVFQLREFKNTTKNVLQKKSCRKAFYKKFDQKSKTDFFSIFFNHVFGRFSMRGFQKHDKKISKQINLVLFRTLTYPPTTGVPVFFFVGPLAGAPARGGGWWLLVAGCWILSLISFCFCRLCFDWQ
jgi:hypothetical protein